MSTIDQYESAALFSLQEADDNGEEAPATVTIEATINHTHRFLLVPRSCLHEVRKAIIKEGGTWRASFI